MTFFVDNNLSPKLVRGMAAFGEDVTHLQDRYPADAKDTDWLPRIGRDEWIIRPSPGSLAPATVG
ncbi:MAG: hypothetical protein A3H97_07170 [Acidobacteria bacterium RIFCSPLOWO2_02_FULL_65_29]|nr:MAG: hypothetical protein A3H97_07170 [Acidobacteria bacterium RIFCSPLOWO2_02_FULL_65_29]